MTVCQQFCFVSKLQSLIESVPHSVSLCVSIYLLPAFQLKNLHACSSVHNSRSVGNSCSVVYKFKLFFYNRHTLETNCWCLSPLCLHSHCQTPIWLLSLKIEKKCWCAGLVVIFLGQLLCCSGQIHVQLCDLPFFWSNNTICFRAFYQNTKVTMFHWALHSMSYK